MTSSFKFYYDGNLKEIPLVDLLVRDINYNIKDPLGNIYVPKAPSSASEIAPSGSLWIKTIDAGKSQLRYGSQVIAEFNPATGNLIYGLGNISNVSVANGGTGATTAATARTNLGIGAIATLSVGTGANNVVQLDGTAKLPALDASNLINLPTLPAGLLGMFISDTPPTGWIKANGALLLRSSYPTLFAAIGTTYGAGDGSTTFRVPDVRGEFVRAFDDGRGVDGGRGFGTFQDFTTQDHAHTVNANIIGLSPGGLGIITLNTGSATGVNGMSSGNIGAETRPRNLAFLACIKI